jgi:small GTP-binding protein
MFLKNQMNLNPSRVKSLKVLLVGAPETGKTSLLRRFTGTEMDSEYIPTLNSDLVVKNVTIGGKEISAQIWDMAGKC